MSIETPGTVLALQAALRYQDQYIRRLEQAVKDLFDLVQKGRVDQSDLPMLDLIHQLLDGENDP